MPIVNESTHFLGTPVSPLVRVVIPAFRVSGILRDAVECVLQSSGSISLEVFVVDDGGNGDLRKLLFGLPLTIVSTGASGSAAIARNRGAEGFTGKFLVFIDSDVLVDSRCIETLLEPLLTKRAEATVGNYSRNVCNLPFPARYKQLYTSKIYQRRTGYLQNEFWTAIGGIDADVFRRLKGFDPRYRGAGGEDTDLGRRMTEASYRTLAVPTALGDHRHLLSLRQLVRNDWRKGLLAMDNHFASEGSLSHNRHATRRDMLAVALMALVSVAMLAAPFVHTSIYMTALLSVLVAFYLATRADVLRVFSGQGYGFLLQAACLMFCLDAMRLACFAVGGCRGIVDGGRSSGPAGNAAEMFLSMDDAIQDKGTYETI